MCYAISYDCTVTCINSDLNVTKLAEGVIASVSEYGNQCTISCLEGIRDANSWAMTYNTPLPSEGLSLPFGLNPINTIIAVVLTIIALLIVYYLCTSYDKPGAKP